MHQSDRIMSSHQASRCSQHCKRSFLGASGRCFAPQISFIDETFMKKPSASHWHLCLRLWLFSLVKETLALPLKSVMYHTHIHAILFYYKILANWISGLRTFGDMISRAKAIKGFSFLQTSSCVQPWECVRVCQSFIHHPVTPCWSKAFSQCLLFNY